MNQYLKIIKQRKIRHIWFVGKWWRHKKTNNNLYFLFHVPNKYITYVIRYPSNVLISRFPRDISHILSTQMAWFFKLASFSRTQNGWVFSINIPSQNEKPFVSATKIFHLRSDYDVSNRNIKYINQLIKLTKAWLFFSKNIPYFILIEVLYQHDIPMYCYLYSTCQKLLMLSIKVYDM